jgi:hypothetical protein
MGVTAGSLVSGFLGWVASAISQDGEGQVGPDLGLLAGKPSPGNLLSPFLNDPSAQRGWPIATAS